MVPTHENGIRKVEWISQLLRRELERDPDMDLFSTSRFGKVLTSQTEFDLMEELAEPVPVACIGAILGVAPDTLATFRQWLEAIVKPIKDCLESSFLTKHARSPISSFVSFNATAN